MSSCCSGAILYKQVYLLNSNVVYRNHDKISSDILPLWSVCFTSFLLNRIPFFKRKWGPTFRTLQEFIRLVTTLILAALKFCLPRAWKVTSPARISIFLGNQTRRFFEPGVLWPCSPYISACLFFPLHSLFPPGRRLQMWDLSYFQSEINFWLRELDLNLRSLTLGHPNPDI